MNANTTSAPIAKTRKVADAVDTFEVLLDGEIVGRITKATKNVATKQGNARTGYKLKTVWNYSIPTTLVPLNQSRGTVITTKADAVAIIIETVTAAR